jgi:HSP20 family protein
MHQEAAGNVASASTGSPSGGENEKKGEGDAGMQTFRLAPGPQPRKQSDPFNMMTPTPLNPNAWDPFKEMEEVHKQMDRMFDDAFGRFDRSPQFSDFAQGFSFNPKSEISEDDHQYTVHIDLPGVDQSKIKAKLDGRTLTISGVYDAKVEHKLSGKEIVKEKEVGEFERVMTLPGPAKSEGMKVNYDKGVLTITIPKDTSYGVTGLLPIQ